MDIYEQPLVNDNHVVWTEEVLSNFLPNLQAETKNVLDIGCGQGLAKEMFEMFGWEWFGVTMGPDYTACRQRELPVYNADMLDLSIFPDNQFELLYSRHSAEHSVAPLLMLMEWHRIGRHGLIFVVPKPQLELGGEGEVLGGLNHYSLLTQLQWEALLSRAGWNPVWEDKSQPAEVRLFCQKHKRPLAPANSVDLMNRIRKEWGEK